MDLDYNDNEYEYQDDTSDAVGCCVILLIVIIILISMVYFGSSWLTPSTEQLPEGINKHNPALWTDNPEIEFTIQLVHNGYTDVEVLHLSANMFTSNMFPVTNKTIDEATIKLLNKRREELNSSVRAEFGRMHVNDGDCHDEIIDGISYFTCQIN